MARTITVGSASGAISREDCPFDVFGWAGAITTNPARVHTSKVRVWGNRPTTNAAQLTDRVPTFSHLATADVAVGAAAEAVGAAAEAAAAVEAATLLIVKRAATTWASSTSCATSWPA